MIFKSNGNRTRKILQPTMKAAVNLGILRFMKYFTIVLFSFVLVSCGTDPLTVEKSPNKSKIAMAYTKRIGDSHTFISIEDKSGKNTKIIMKLVNVVPVSFEWISNNELKIYLPDKSLISSSDLTYPDVSITTIEKNH